MGRFLIIRHLITNRQHWSAAYFSQETIQRKGTRETPIKAAAPIQIPFRIFRLFKKTSPFTFSPIKYCIPSFSRKQYLPPGIRQKSAIRTKRPCVSMAEKQGRCIHPHILRGTSNLTFGFTSTQAGCSTVREQGVRVLPFSL